MEQIENGKSANQIWKESNTTLSFADWIQREKDKGRFLPNSMVQDITESIKASLGIDQTTKTIAKKDNSVVGLSKPIIVISILIILGAVGYSIYQKNNK